MVTDGGAVRTSHASHIAADGSDATATEARDIGCKDATPSLRARSTCRASHLGTAATLVSAIAATATAAVIASTAAAVYTTATTVTQCNHYHRRTCSTQRHCLKD